MSRMQARASIRRAPGWSVRERVVAERLRFHPYAEPRCIRNDVVTAANDDRIDEVLVKMVDVLDDAILQ